jgi:signal transduction histidine kinase/HAMP domain-containing protein
MAQTMKTPKKKNKDKISDILLTPDSAGTENKKFFGLGAKLIILVLSSLLFITVFTTIVSIRHLRNALSAGSQEMAETMGRVVGLASAYQGFFDADNRIQQQYIDFTVKQKNVAYAAIVRTDGEIVQTGLTPEQLDILLNGDNPFPPESIHQEKQDILMDSPIGKIGTIYLGISKKEIAAIEGRLIKYQLIFAGAITVIFLLLLWGIILSITRPLRQLTKKTKEMGEGRLDEPLAVTGVDEVGLLATSIELMRKNLNRKIQTISFQGRLAHDFNAVLDLDETIEELKKEILSFPVWPWYEMGIAVIGRGGDATPRTQFIYHHIVPGTDSEENPSSIFALKNTLVENIFYKKETIVRDLPTSLISSKDGFSLYLKGRDISSSIAVPLLIKNKALGMLYAGFQDRSGRFPELQKICENIADELARAIEGIYLLSDLRLSLAKLKSAHHELKGLDNLKSEFISSVSHELRTPLVSMTGYLHMMLDEKLGKITPLQQEGLEVSVKSLQRLTNLIQKMLTFSSEQKETELELSDFPIKNVLDHCVSALKSVAYKKQIDLQIAAQDNLPLVRADEDKIIQVIINLTHNALKFSPEGSQIDLIARRAYGSGKANRIEVAIKDQGKGISKEDQANIFEKFWQATDTDGDKRKGIGLGLALVHKILSRHGCSIEVASKLGHGTTMTFTLPTAPTG